MSNSNSNSNGNGNNGGHSSRSKRSWSRRERLVVHDDGEGNWLISYADMMTLLMGFFVMITIFSTPNSAMFEKLRQETSKSMGGTYQKPYEELSTNIKNILKELGLEKEINIEETTEGMTIRVSGVLFFDSGSTELKPNAIQWIDRIAQVLLKEAKTFRVVVEGHTDDIPILSQRFPSNWELSSARAGQVVRFLEHLGFPHENLRPIGYADAEPLVPNRDEAGNGIPENRAQNRRIVIRIQKDFHSI